MADFAREPWTRLLYAEASPWATGAGLALSAGIAAGWWLMRRQRRWLAIAATVLGTIGAVDLGEQAFEAVQPRQSGFLAARAMQEGAARGARLYSVRIYDQTVPWYLRRTLKLVDYRDEFGFGLDADPARHLDMDAFGRDWGLPGEALAIMHPDTFQAMRAGNLPMQVLHQDPKRVVVRKP